MRNPRAEAPEIRRKVNLDEEIAGYEQDAIEDGGKHTESIKKFERADTIIRIVQGGLKQSIEFQEKI